VVNCHTNVNFNNNNNNNNNGVVVNLEKKFQFRQNLRTFPIIVSNNYSRISGKMGFAIEDKALIIIDN
jgi:hypothetical protein